MAKFTGVKGRGRRKTAAPPPGKEAFEIVGPSGELLRTSPYGEGPAVALAQGLAQKYTEPVELQVRLRPLFGPLDTLYRVLRCEDGSISTYREQ